MMRASVRRAVTMLVLPAAVIACRTARAADAGDSASAAGADTLPMLTLERSGCRGFCPAYTLRVFADGRVIFDGARHVRVSGTATAVVSAATISALQATFTSRQFAAMPSLIDARSAACGEYAADLPAVTLTFTSAGTPHRVHWDEGCMGRPAVLDSLAQRTDSAVRSAQWITSDSGSSR